MITAIPRLLLDDPAVSDRAFRLYCLLHVEADGGQVTISRRDIAERLNCSTDTVDRALRQLDDAGALAITANTASDGGPAPSTYRPRPA